MLLISFIFKVEMKGVQTAFLFPLIKLTQHVKHKILPKCGDWYTFYKF